MEYRKEAALGASLYRRRPCVGSVRFGLANQFKYVDYAFPNGLTLKRLGPIELCDDLRIRHGQE
jgi:hypothetical protein